jgi:transcriptional regulator with XRE-family HTH domain
MSKTTTSARRKQIIAGLANKAYRDAFVGAEISTTLPFQIRSIREKRGWTQGQLAQRSHHAQPTISKMERAGYDQFTLTTLKRLASAFDCGLLVRFVPFSQLVDWSSSMLSEQMDVPGFDHDPGLKPDADLCGRIIDEAGTATATDRSLIDASSGLDDADVIDAEIRHDDVVVQ